MNSSDAVPPVIPGQFLGTPSPQHDPSLPGERAGDRVPITNVASAVEAILREPRRVLFNLRQPRANSLLAVLLTIFIACSATYGFVIGTFSGGAQLWAAPVKVTAGLLFSALICLPSLYIFACLGGSRARLIEVAGLLVGLLTLTTVLLIGFAPVAWVFSQSTESVNAMGAFHLVFWFIAAVFGLRFLHWGFDLLGTPVCAGIKIWMALFLVVVLQMSTSLRPLVGKADTLLPKEKKFFVTYWMDNLGDTHR